MDGILIHGCELLSSNRPRNQLLNEDILQETSGAEQVTNTDVDILADKIATRISAQPRWLKLRQAALYSSIGQKKLKSLAEKGEIVGYPDPETEKGVWVFDRLSIDKYRMKPWRKKEVISDELFKRIDRFL